ncbi:MAG: AEC family transporter [Treponema sp.]|nr:AEC family transporter [Candidatus Treponema equifaecale]
MLSKLFFTCNAVLPVVLTILVGYVLKNLKVFPQDFFKLLNKLSFRCCLPTMLFYNVYNVSNLGAIANYGKVCAFTFVAILGTFVIAAVLCGLFVKDVRQKGVMVQAAYRSNNAIIGLSLVISLVGNEFQAIAVASILSSLFIPLFNILAVLSLTMFMKEEGKKFDLLSILKKIATNPLIIGCGSGFVFLVIRYFIPETTFLNEEGIEITKKVFTIKDNLPFLYRTIQMVGSCATPVALIALGGTFTFSAVARLKKLITIGTLARVLIVPVSTLVCAYFFGFREVEFPALIALFGTPTAVSSVPMATEMNNDDELAGQLVVWTSILSAFTLFGIIFACAQVGIFKV